MTVRSALSWHVLRLPALAVVWTVAVLWFALAIQGYGHANMIGVDSHAYWASAQHWHHLYSLRPGQRDAFLYSPVFALALHLLGWLPWHAFAVVWAGASVAVAAWLLRPLGAWMVPVLLLVSAQDIVLGNIGTFGAAVLVLGLGSSRRWWHPALLALLPLSKVTTGLPVAWLLLRREWRALGVVTGTVAALSGASYAVVPSWWSDWLHLLSDRQGAGQPWRFGAALVLVVLAAVLDRKVLLAVALPLCLPFIGSISIIAWGAGVPRLWRDDVERRRCSTDGPLPAQSHAPDLALTAGAR